jgi:type VI secretion system protein ImpG
LEANSRALFEDFLQELQALNEFRAAYSARHEFEALGNDDQDVRRLVEALAFYSARTRRASDRAFAAYRRQVLRKLFPQLLSPMPQMALLCPELDANMQEVRVLPKGAQLSCYVQDEAGERRALTFRTREATPLWPLCFVQGSFGFERLRAHSAADVSLQSGSAAFRMRFSLAVSSQSHVRKRFYDSQQHPLRELTFHVNPGSEPMLALRLFRALEESCVRAVCRFWSAGVNVHTSETHRVRFGPLAEVGGADASYENPVERTRRALHFPFADLRITIPLVTPPSEWNVLEVELDLDARWPSELALTPGALLLNGVVVENLERGSAVPLEVDGRALRVPLFHPEPARGLRLREVYGVYEADPKTPGARSAVFPELLVNGGYSVDVEPSTGEAWLMLDDAGDVEHRADAVRKVHLDGEWYHPEGLSDVELRLGRFVTDTLELAVSGWRVAAHTGPRSNTLAADEIALERLIEIQGQSTLSVEDLRQLLTALGVSKSELFLRLPRYIRNVQTSVARDASAPLGGTRCIDVGVDALPAALSPSAWLLFGYFAEFFGFWTGDAAVRLKVSFVGEQREPWVFEWSATHG